MSYPEFVDVPNHVKTMIFRSLKPKKLISVCLVSKDCNASAQDQLWYKQWLNIAQDAALDVLDETMLKRQGNRYFLSPLTLARCNALGSLESQVGDEVLREVIHGFLKQFGRTKKQELIRRFPIHSEYIDSMDINDDFFMTFLPITGLPKEQLLELEDKRRSFSEQWINLGQDAMSAVLKQEQQRLVNIGTPLVMRQLVILDELIQGVHNDFGRDIVMRDDIPAAAVAGDAEQTENEDLNPRHSKRMKQYC